MTDIPLQYSNQAADQAFIWESTDTTATLIFPPRPNKLLSVISDFYELVLAVACLAVALLLDSRHMATGAWPLWVIIIASGVINTIRRALARQPNTLRITHGWIKVDSAVSQTLRRKRFRLEPLLPVRLDSDLSQIKEARVIATGFHYRGYLLGKLVITNDQNRSIDVGSGRPVRDLEKAEKLLRTALYNAGWRPPRTALMQIGRSLGRALHKILPA